MASIEYTTKDGDVLDDILKSYYGEGVKVLQDVLLSNPGLAERGSVYRSGVKITLPDIPKRNVQPMYRPWGLVGA